MLQQTNVYLQRLIALRDEGFPLAFAARERGHLYFDFYFSHCGTYRCLLGWWVATPTAQEDGWRFADDAPTRGGNLLGFSCAEDYFGISHKDALRLFGLSEQGDLEDRLAYLNDLIAARMEV